MVMIGGENINSSQLLRKYREAEIASSNFKSLLLDDLENFFIDLNDRPESYYEAWLNLKGKYIVVDDYSQRDPLDKEIINEICWRYSVTYEGMTKEVHEDYEGNTNVCKITYLFEIKE